MARGSGKLLSAWSRAEPHQRRNAVLSALAVVWAGALYLDMRQLKEDPRVREKFKLDTDSPEAQAVASPLSTFRSNVMGKLWPKDGDW